jgi:hypothetical protein
MDTQLPNSVTKAPLADLEKDFRENLVTRRIHALLTSIYPQSSPKIVADLVGCTIDEAVNSLDVLTSLRFIKNSEKGYVPTGPEEYKHTITSKSITERRNVHRELLLQISNELISADNQADMSVVVATDRETFMWYTSELQKLNDQLLEKSAEIKSKNVIVSSVSGVILNKIKGDFQ